MEFILGGMGSHKICFLVGRGRKWVVLPVLCILLWMGQWYTTAVGLPLSPYPACGCLYLCLSSRPYILCHESYPVQWLPQVGPTVGAGMPLFARRIRESLSATAHSPNTRFPSAGTSGWKIPKKHLLPPCSYPGIRAV